jgi:DNA polymerase II small subunit
MIEIEDETGVVPVLVLNDKRTGGCFEKAGRVVNDEVIAIDIKTSQNFNFAVDIIWPEMPISEKKKTEKDISIAFLSDMHFGSKMFCGKEFEAMLKWLNGVGEGKEIAEKVGYLLVAGDLIDGIGIYPKQEKELVIKDVYDQYKLLADMFELVPDHIKVVIAPGNHDAVRLAEPQPAIPEEMFPVEYSLSNPGRLTIEGLKTIINHGSSLNSLIYSIPGLSFSKPEEAAVELLKRRNLCPIYDGNDIAPEHNDYLFVKDCDILHTGHLHKNGYNEYRGCVAVASGTWQRLTEYQIKQGHVATPCVLQVYNLKEARITEVDFNGEPKVLA